MVFNTMQFASAAELLEVWIMIHAEQLQRSALRQAGGTSARSLVQELHCCVHSSIEVPFSLEMGKNALG